MGRMQTIPPQPDQQTITERHFLGIPQLSLRSIVLTALGAILIAFSSTYVAMRMSALPWPNVFVAVLSMALLKLLGKSDLHEINITQTGMSSGAMVAGGIAFTIPGLWISGIYTPFDPSQQTLREWFMPKLWPLLLVALAGVVLGTMLCWYLRKRSIEEQALPYPIGTAAAETLRAGDSGGHKAAILFASLGGSALFTVLRDKLALIPQTFAGKLGQLPLELYASPMAIGIGYIIGFPAALYWLIGAVIGQIALRQFGVQAGTFSSPDAAGAFILTSAVGLMVGSGLGILLQFLSTLRLPARGQAAGSRPGLKPGFFALISSAAAFVLSIMAGLSPAIAALLMLGVVFATLMSSVITGQTGINPMEVFGIIVLLAIRLILPVNDLQAFLVAAIVAVACGYAGDAMNDYKTGALLGTDPRAQFVTQMIGGLVGVAACVVALLLLISQYGGVGGDTGLSAAQAHSVTAMVQGIGDPVIFAIAALLGCILYLNKVPAMIIGIGMLLSLGMAAAIFLGATAAWLFKRYTKTSDDDSIGNIIAAGLLGGEGITGTILAFLMMLGR